LTPEQASQLIRAIVGALERRVAHAAYRDYSSLLNAIER
jgi:hypothetical protein